MGELPLERYSVPLPVRMPVPGAGALAPALLAVHVKVLWVNL